MNQSETVPIERFRELAKTNENHYQEACTLRTRLQQVESERDKAEADAAVMREAAELVLENYSFVSCGSREPISTAMKRPENEMNVFRLVISLNNLKKKCGATNAGKSLLERLKEAEWLLLHSNDLPHPDDWFDRRDALLNPTNKDVM